MGKSKRFARFLWCFDEKRRCEHGDVYTKQVTPNVMKVQVETDGKANKQTIWHDNVHEQDCDGKYQFQFYTQLISI